MTMWMPLMMVAALFAPPDSAAGNTVAHSGRLSVKAVDTAPPRETTLDDEALDRLADAVREAPRDRDARVALVHGLVDAGQLDKALAAAKAWREVDAYNLVVVRMQGDILTELGRDTEALRVYSAVTELLAEDPEAHRALATVLKQQGALAAAHARLDVAHGLRPSDARLQFELADVSLRLERHEQALALLEAIADADETPSQLRHPAKQRLAQVYSQLRRQARDEGRDEAAEALQTKQDALALSGGNVNDIKVYLTWDTDRTDVDLWVRTPKGEKIFYSHRKGRNGEALFDDVTTGYGPESFTAKSARPGTYTVQVNYFGGTGASEREARGEVLVVLNEGRDDEVQQTFPYRLFKPKQTVTVAKIEVTK